MAASLGAENSWKSHQSFKFKYLRPIAQRQLESLLRRMKLTRDYSRYAGEIEKILINEKKRQESKYKAIKAKMS